MSESDLDGPGDADQSIAVDHPAVGAIRGPAPPRKTHHAVALMVLALACYVGLAYGALPLLWKHYEHEKKLAGMSMVTTTSLGLPGDPVNLAFVGSARDILCAMHAAGWYPADPVTLRSSLEISGSVLLDRPYPTAPVSPLYYAGRSEDLAFEKPDGRSADRRHHVRLWQVLAQGDQGRPVWLAAATFDRGIRLSRYTGAVTHRIAPDIDLDRKLIATALQDARLLQARYDISGIGPTLMARNGGGDLYFTDGELWVLQLVEDCRRRDAPPELPATPIVTQFKDRLWKSLADTVSLQPH
ncbi:MAG: LssY C-terminal domain-containing protein [Xanthobacteraceae bacterium]